MAGKSLLISLLFIATCLSYSLAQEKCSFDPNPDCTNNEMEGWRFWNNMHYKYFPKKLSWKDADEACVPWDEDLCLGEETRFRYRAYLASYVSQGEDDVIFGAYNDACIQTGELFWIGIKYTYNSGSYFKITYTDNTSTSKFHSFDGGVPSRLDASSGQCVAYNARTRQMVTTPCSEKLGYVCKIQPNKH